MTRCFVLLLAGPLVFCCGRTPLLGQAVDAAPSGDLAALVLSAFECSVYSGFSHQPEEETRRLFQLGYDAGKQFLEAARRGLISEEDMQEKVPMRFHLNAAGPTDDFKLGRMFEVAEKAATESVYNMGGFGRNTPMSEWRTDPEVREAYASSEYLSRNCALLK